MKAKKEVIAFDCSPHQAHLLRRYAKSIMTSEQDIDELVRKRAAQLHYAQLPLNQLGQSIAAQQRHAAEQQAPCGGGLFGALGGLSRIF